MYNKLTGVITKSIMRTVRDVITSPSPKYKNYTVRKNPPRGKCMQFLFDNEYDSIQIGDFKDTKCKVSVTVTLKFKISKTIPIGQYYINGYADELYWPNMEILLAINPDDGVSVLNYLNSNIREVVRHEIEHFTQRGVNVKPSKKIRHNDAIRSRIKDQPDVVYRYFLLKDEIDANLHGLYAKSKSLKKPYKDVILKYLDNYVIGGEMTLKQSRTVYNKWRSRALKIGGLPKLERL